MRLGYINNITEDQLEASTPLSLNYPISNTIDSFMVTKYKSLNSGSILISFRGTDIVGVGNAVAIKASMCVVNAHNLVSGDAITLKGYPTEVSVTPSVTHNFTLQEYGTAIIFTEATLFWEIEISVANPVEIGGIFLGEHMITPSYQIGAKTSYITNDKYTISKSGQLFGDAGYYKRLATYLFPWITEDEKGTWLSFWKTVGTIVPFYLLQFPDRQDLQPIMYCHFTSKELKLEEHEGNRSLCKDVVMSVEEVF